MDSQNISIKLLKDEIGKRHIDLKGNILILSDRLIGLSSVLEIAIKKDTDAQVVRMISNYTEYENLKDKEKVDYLIMVGYLRNERNYDIMKDLQKRNLDIKSVIWANLDEAIEYDVIRFNIPYKYHRSNPVHEFFDFLNEI